ncbi:3-dehydroquinate synthase [Altererythrobacter atlanticus]|uniref:3-dehydroquinate synthase n=1 Tax=Croceibacterium atlanticum TaxID=1267766 RepID=A0A0F7KSP4_9SPHN|nr:3-dehydroquinate synthase [Croceibacterium atlanticum]AKH41780.1 3-dehydroquinate synthase [Croceibacterium atlanticum]MBB5733245.1 3-dehydroquinate synthase [Croceibacterium atlanticum]
MAIIPVELAGRSYEVRVASGLLADIAGQCALLLRKKRVPIVTDSNVAEHWRATVEKSLIAAGHEPRVLVLDPGEGTKSWHVLERVMDWLLAEEVERGDHILALGGGVIGDLTGFAAAILKRGCGFIQLPTSLLAQVDSSVGGKTAINTGAGKNLVGAFHQPALVLADLDTLDTLPAREMRAGYAEVIKYGILGDREFFDWCMREGPEVVTGGISAQEFAVTQSVKAKARIVAEDERETSGARALLNLGHTFGHALEAQTGFSDRLLHGEGVALGMVLAARYSARKGYITEADAALVTAAIASAGLPTEIASLGLNCDGQTLAGHMLHDKKMDAGTLPFVLLRAIGEAFLDKQVSLEDVAAFLGEQLQAH